MLASSDPHNAESSIVKLIDFGLASPFLDEATGVHIPLSEVESFSGNICFSSPNVMEGIGKLNFFDSFSADS